MDVETEIDSSLTAAKKESVNAPCVLCAYIVTPIQRKRGHKECTRLG